MFDRQSLHIAMLLWGCIFSLLAACCIHINRNFDREKSRWLLCIQLTSAVLLFSDTLAWGYRGSMAQEAALLVRISNFLVFFLSDAMLFFFHGYVCCYLFPDSVSGNFREKIWKNKNVRKDRDLPNRRIFLVFVLAVFCAGMVIVSQFTHWYYYIDSQNVYHRNFGHPLSMLLPMCGMLLDVSLLVQYRERLEKEVYLAMLSYTVLPMISAVILLFYYGISLTNLSISVSVLFMFIATLMEQSRAMAKKEQEAADLRCAIMVSQIQPHFLYNSLNTIYHLCDRDTAQAKEAISDFSEYLHHILKSVNCAKPIPFTEELQHVKAYVKLEQMRFEDFQMIYEIETTDFVLPALSVQPLVENAVKHGIFQKEDGGSVRLVVKEAADAVEITVTDDGVGFVPEEIAKDGKLHTGIVNVRQRVERMCGGTLGIYSRPGHGTIVCMRLPRENRK